MSTTKLPQCRQLSEDVVPSPDEMAQTICEPSSKLGLQGLGPMGTDLCGKLNRRYWLDLKLIKL